MTTVVYSVLPYVSYFDRDQSSLANGIVYFYDQNTRLPKAVYLDAAATVAVTKVDFDIAGRLPQLYYETDVAYYIEAYREGSRPPAATAWTLSSFTPPSSGSSPPVTNYVDYDNLVINGQFSFFENIQFLTVPTTIKKIAPDAHYFRKDGTGATDQIDFEKFTLDSIKPDGTPINYFKYTCTIASITETYKDYIYIIKNVRSLARQDIALSLGGASLSGADKPVEVILERYYGTGGSPSATDTTSIISWTLISSFERLTQSFTMPSLTGKAIGTNNDDEIRIIVRMPLNQACEIGLTNIYYKFGDPVNDYPYKTYAQVYAQVRAAELPEGTKDKHGQLIAYQETPYNSGGSYALIDSRPIGTLTFTPMNLEPAGEVKCNGQAFARAGIYGRLFNGETLSIGHNFTCLSGFSAKTDGTTDVIIEADLFGACTAPDPATSPFTLTVSTTGDATHRQEITITFTAGSTITNSDYFLISTPSRKFLIWCHLDNVFYSDMPVVAGYESIEVKILAADTDTEVRDKIYAVMNQVPPNGILSHDNFTAIASSSTVNIISNRKGIPTVPATAGTSSFTVTVVTSGSATVREEISIVCPAPATIKHGDYFGVGLPGTSFGVYFIKDGVGEEPIGTGYLYLVPVQINSSDSSEDVATALQIIMNNILYYIPDWRGLFMRMYGDSATSIWNNDPGTRTNNAGGKGVADNVLSSLEKGDLEPHTHTSSAAASASTRPVGSAVNEAATTGSATGLKGSNESRPKNFNVYALMKAY